MRFELVTRPERLRKLEPQWWELWHAAGATPFQAPAWLLPWLDVFTYEPSLRTIAVHGERGLDALFPLFVFDYRGERLAAPLGIGISDYLDVLVRPGAATSVCEIVAEALEQVAAEVDRLLIEDIPEGSVLRSFALSAQADVGPHAVCPRLSLGGSYEDYERGLPKFVRYNLRHGLAKLSSRGVIGFHLADQASLDRSLGALFALHAARWRDRGEPGVLREARVQAFHRAAGPELLAHGLLRLWLLSLEDRPVAAAQVFLGRDAYFYLSGYEPALAECNLGSLIVAHAIRDAFTLGKVHYDFLRGSERYKYHFGAADTVTHRIELRRPVRLAVSS